MKLLKLVHYEIRNAGSVTNNQLLTLPLTNCDIEQFI